MGNQLIDHGTCLTDSIHHLFSIVEVPMPGTMQVKSLPDQIITHIQSKISRFTYKSHLSSSFSAADAYQLVLLSSGTIYGLINPVAISILHCLACTCVRGRGTVSVSIECNTTGNVIGEIRDSSCN